ncbi:MULTISPECIES: SusD/RagB family nutrient-binding outer membrane lipoprotein [Galbibacter]|uniref:SusD/RagB family nutrient-binding outer membrane lipoprotein n=1 Tax=Galbibacter pacificus TaxID=2996052 RepID=A0ABT6FM49_9FLAO|nr:SusD/RagB family nutrient-binding outer membrane lipoprotein [Galbibacter pacificus]MDG3580863.1 SusD/RagB family nutrient-binding outer membrane lipoprotein [Galbibacter pacificus]MDG3584341.1 SusD/RagB family nutrient-binding outer membrane lipoprotein [Galbibacter pacificus]
MKKIFVSIFTIALVLSSCQSDDKYESYNEDPKNPQQVASGALFTSATKSLFDQMTSTSVNLNVYRLLSQYWTETTYIDESNYDLNGRNITQNHWSEMYRDVLFDLKDAKAKVMEDPELSSSEKTGRLAQIELLAIYTWQQLVDSFGDIPYTQALDIENYPLPEYDDAATIYEDLISRINTVIPDFQTGSGYMDEDQIYEGDMAQWSKFANSVKLRLGIRLSDVNPSLAQQTVEAAVAAGVFTSNEDNALIPYQGFAPNTNPLWVDLVQSGRSDFVVASTIVDFMNGLDDPRRMVYFDDNLGADTYEGGPYGDNNNFNSYTHIGPVMLEPTYPGDLLDYAEVSFYLAEAAARSYNVGGTVEEFYEEGITASFEYWNAGDASAYLAMPEVAYATAPGADWREKIGNQFWIAMYNRGFEGWTVWRKYDINMFTLPVSSENPIPTRYTYPINEQNLNEANWSAASDAIGGDNQTTKLFWDVN